MKESKQQSRNETNKNQDKPMYKIHGHLINQTTNSKTITWTKIKIKATYIETQSIKIKNKKVKSYNNHTLPPDNKTEAIK